LNGFALKDAWTFKLAGEILKQTEINAAKWLIKFYLFFYLEIRVLNLLFF